MGTMFDSVNKDLVENFKGLRFDAVAAYANGHYANYSIAEKEFPHLHLLEIDVANGNVGNAGDFERGDMAYADAGTWAKKRIAAGVKRPVIYFQASAWGDVMDSLRAAGLPRTAVRIWTAHYTGTEHLCSSTCGHGITNADATQWDHRGAKGTLPPQYAKSNVDVSPTSDSFWD